MTVEERLKGKVFKLENLGGFQLEVLEAMQEHAKQVLDDYVEEHSTNLEPFKCYLHKCKNEWWKQYLKQK